MGDELKGIHTELVTHDHEYTSVDVPWQMDEDGSPSLFRYLRGGGVKAFGLTSHQVARERRQTRFLVLFSIFAFVWLILWLF